MNSLEWFEDDSETTLDYPFHDYDIISSPNDFNVLTLFNFVDKGTVVIPGFQRHYVWDIKRASKLIESIIMGLPIPQIFLYEQGRNRFSVIDGQQRLMSIYYFMKQRFPRSEKRSELRTIFEQEGKVPDHILFNDLYFTKFNLALPTQIPNQKNKFNGLNYSTLGDYQSGFELRPIRSIIVKQVSPEEDDSSIYEIFNRLNSGGVNLRPQEIRSSLYHSDFYSMLYRINLHPRWRELVGFGAPDLHMKDIEFLLRGFAMLIEGATYNSAMVKFLNDFSRHAKGYDESKIQLLENIFVRFLEGSRALPDDAFLGTTDRFSITIYESVFVAAAEELQESDEKKIIDPQSVQRLKSEPDFLFASEKASASKSNVAQRLALARNIIQLVE